MTEPAESTSTGHSSRPRIAIATSHPQRFHQIVGWLGAVGFDVRIVRTSNHMTPGMASGANVMLLDLTDSDHGALAALGRFLDQPHVPLVAFTAAQDLLSGIAALEAGADDLLSATMPAAELIARVRAVLRRQRGVRAPQPEAVLTGGPVVLDTGRRRVEVNGEQVFLTALEFNLLSYFLTHPGQAISRECLLESVWGYSVGGTATVTVHVRRIREKIEENPADPMLIRTVWGIGYRFSPGGP